MSKIKNTGSDQYGAEPFEHHQFGTAGVEWVKSESEVDNRFLILFAGYCWGFIQLYNIQTLQCSVEM